MLRGVPQSGGAEFAIYTDCRATGDLPSGAGPYTVLNTLPMFGDEGIAEVAVIRREARPLILRVNDHLRAVGGFGSETWLMNSSIDDDIASLLAVVVGRRFGAGGLTREFSPGGDPLGQPFEFRHQQPYLPQPGGLGWQQIPEIRNPIHLPDVGELLATFPNVSGSAAAVLVRAARRYREALWIADGDPQEAWLRLIGACEVAAGYGEHQKRPVPALQDWHPQLAAALDNTDAATRTHVAELLWPVMRSTQRFVGFLESHLPPPPDKRPAAGYRVDWNHIRPSFLEIYARRGETLHAGLPVPWALWAPPRASNGGWWEVMPGLGSSSGGIEYDAKETPMLLHTFAYIVRGALIKWWLELADSGD